MKNESGTTNRRDEILSPIYNTQLRENWILYLSTGFGKTKAAIDWINKYHEPNTEYIWLVPTQTLRDTDVPIELKKWNCVRNPTVLCYTSSSKIPIMVKQLRELNKKIVLILDEAHKITKRSYDNIKGNYDNILMLTATKPKDLDKQLMLNSLLQKQYKENIISYNINQSADAKITADFEIHLIPFMLDNKHKTIPMGSKGKGKYNVSESYYYNRASATINNLQRIKYAMKSKEDIEKQNKQIEFQIFNRARFIYNLPKKQVIAKQLINKLLESNKNKRILIFAKLIKQIEEITPHVYHSKSSDEALNKFEKQEINILGCVDALNEGKNITNVDTAIIIGLDSNYKNLIQRLGRICRFKEGKKAILYIVYAVDTQERVWVESALQDIDKSRIIRHAIT